MKKRGTIILSILVLSCLLINLNLVSAQTSLYEGIAQVWNNIGLLLTPILTFFLGDVSGALLLNKILILTIIIIMSWIGSQKITIFQDNKILARIVVVAFSILAMKGIGSSQLIDLILTPYTVTGVALSAGLPFLIYFGIVNIGLKHQPDILRRTAWIFFAIIFFGLIATKIGGVGNILRPSTWGIYWIYIMTSFLALGMAFLDGTIKAFFLKVEAKKLEDINNAEILAKILARKQEYEAVRKVDPDTYKILMKNLRKELRAAGIKRKI